MKVKGGKGLFLGLSWFAFIIVIGIIILGIYLISPRMESIYWRFPLILWLAGGLSVIVLGGGLFLITITALTGIDVLYPHGGKSITMDVLFPVVTNMGSFMGWNKEKLRRAFVDTNNALVNAQKKRISLERILVLLPHCLQHHDCPWRITFDVDNCKRCGKCDMAKLAELKDKYETAMRVATGGTLARKVVSDFKPTLIVAVACGRDLSSGIIDSYPIPVYGVLNSRPNGPCFDTKVDVNEIEQLIEEFKIIHEKRISNKRKNN